MQKSTGLDFDPKDAVYQAHKAMALVQEERGDTDPKPF